MSDGLANEPTLCIDFLEARIRHGQAVPVIHTVGFFPDQAPENFEGRRLLQTLSSMTGGTFQEFDKDAHRIYREGVGFVDYQLSSETHEERTERLWAEGQLRAERKKNLRLGIVERLEATMARVQALHQQSRVRVAESQHEAELAAAKSNYEAQVGPSP